MKAKTISIIKDILEQNYNTAFTNFRNIEGNLMYKYGANYNTSVTPSEKETFLDALHEMNDYCDALDDFYKHNWN